MHLYFNIHHSSTSSITTNYMLHSFDNQQYQVLHNKYNILDNLLFKIWLSITDNKIYT